ncbi:DNA-binding response regulator [Chitinophaga cymbidii]|uniref:DNA-binding response regulator n=1 Tax=Chitinophaga cymbidii TaxID=1096750 RepID=A0A512RPX1_9BACT|nr:DNA-binding response regulator [Chitinophaga cymbidii]
MVVEDEPELGADIAGYLTEYTCEMATTFSEALEKIGMYTYDCILLDLTLPGGDGLRLLDILKQEKRDDGIIIISARNALTDKVTGLTTGADDYIAKPFHLPELAARIYSVIRRKQFSSTNVVDQNEVRIDLLSKKVFVNEKEVALTKKELDLLLYFVGNRNKVISKSALAEHLSGDMADMFDSHAFVYAHIKNLKRKLSEAGYGNYLKNIYGTGYKWEI